MAVTTYAVNACASQASLGFSPFKLDLVRKLPDLLNSAFPLLEQFTNTHEDYLQSPKEKVEFVAGIFLDNKTQ